MHGTVTIGKTVIPAIGLARGTGPMTSSTVITGRPPATAGQIALGGSVLRQLGLRVGQTVTASTPAGTRPMLITGSAVFPYFGQGGFTPTDAGEGAETTAAVLQPLANAGGSGAGGYNVALVSFAPGSARQADVAAFQRAWSSFCAHIGQTTCIVTDQRPNTVTNYAAIDATPEVLAGVLAVLGLAVLAQFILASARRRRRDFALLKVLGMFRRRPERGRVLAGRHRDRGRARRRRAAGHRGRPVGLAAVRGPGRPADRRDHAAAGTVDDPGDPARRRPGRAAPR